MLMFDILKIRQFWVKWNLDIMCLGRFLIDLKKFNYGLINIELLNII